MALSMGVRRPTPDRKILLTPGNAPPVVEKKLLANAAVAIRQDSKVANPSVKKKLVVNPVTQDGMDVIPTAKKLLASLDLTVIPNSNYPASAMRQDVTLAAPTAKKKLSAIPAGPIVEKKILAYSWVAKRQDLSVTAVDPSVARQQASASERFYMKQKKLPSLSYAQSRSFNAKLASSPTRPAALVTPASPPSYQELTKTINNLSERLEAALKSWPTGDLRPRVNEVEIPSERLDVLFAKDEILTIFNTLSKS